MEKSTLIAEEKEEADERGLKNPQKNVPQKDLLTNLIYQRLTRRWIFKLSQSIRNDSENNW